MSNATAFPQRIAELLAAHAARVLPPERADWARAMRNEVGHSSSSWAALQWAGGCVFASYGERIRNMKMGTLRVSRWVLGLEMIMCFWWLTWMFGALASRGVYGFAGPLPIDAWFITMLFNTVLGPLGLVVAFKSIVLDRPRLSRLTKVALCVPAAWTFLAFGIQLVTRGWLAGSNDRPIEALGLFILFAALPVVGVAHLVYLSEARAQTAATA